MWKGYDLKKPLQNPQETPTNIFKEIYTIKYLFDALVSFSGFIPYELARNGSFTSYKRSFTSYIFVKLYFMLLLFVGKQKQISFSFLTQCPDKIGVEFFPPVAFLLLPSKIESSRGLG